MGLMMGIKEGCHFLFPAVFGFCNKEGARSMRNYCIKRLGFEGKQEESLVGIVGCIVYHDFPACNVRFFRKLCNT